MKLKVVSDGTPQGTKVLNAETGEEVDNVYAVTWEARADKPESMAQISLAKIEIEALGEAA